MNAHELRVGNYIAVEDEIAEIVSISKSRIEVRLPSETIVEVAADIAHPIKLAAKLLVNNSLFDEHGRHVVAIDSHLYFLKFHKGHIVLTNRTDEPVIHFWDVKHVHQLQNLYYILKGKEIEINIQSQHL